MEYVLCSTPIVSRRVDRRTPKQKRLAQERWQARFEKLSESFSVGELVQMGFYESTYRPLPYGIEVWSRKCTLRDESSNYEWYELAIPTIALALPKMERLNQVEKFCPMYWEESRTYYWGFRQCGNMPLYCIFDLLNRLFDLPHWDKLNAIPVNWRLGNDKCKTFAQQQLKSINQGKFRLTLPPIPVSALDQSTATIRHEYTPYDYEWQTGKRSRDDAYAYWNQIIKEAKCHNAKN